VLRDPYCSQATIERHSTGTRQSTRAVPTRYRPCTSVFVSAHVRVFVHLHRIFVRVCSYVCVCGERVCAPRRCARPLAARRQRAVSIARPRAAQCSRACVVALGATRRAFGATGRARARRPQVSPGRAARPRRRGLAEVSTRPWSTPPAPSTSSAAKAPTVPPSTRTCGRAPTEVLCRTRSRVVGEYWVVLRDTRGTKGVLRGSAGVRRKPPGVISEYSGGYTQG
jgi:hypothetical protein